MQVEVIGHDGNRVIRHARAHVVAAARQLEHEGFALIGDGVGAAGRRIAPFVHQLHQDARAVAGGLGALGQRAAQVIGNAAVLDARGIVRAFAGSAHAVGGDDHAAFVDKAVRVGKTRFILAVFHPVIAQRVGGLRDGRAAFLSGHGCARRPVARANIAVAHDDVTAVVLVVADQHMARRAGGSASDEGHAVHGDVSKCIQIKCGRIRHMCILQKCVYSQASPHCSIEIGGCQRLLQSRLRRASFLEEGVLMYVYAASV